METNNIEEKIYWQYQNIIAPFIAELEVRDNEFLPSHSSPPSPKCYSFSLSKVPVPAS